jgi:flagellar biosynthesis protein FlhG
VRIVPIASGKGGVGKSLLAANLAIALSQAGKNVYLADLDLGGSNLHLILGMRGVSTGIGVFLNDRTVKFNDIIIPTEYKNLKFIPGDSEIPGIANLKSSQKNKLIRRLASLEGDFLILDLGAGTSYNIMDFFLMSGRGLIITTPTPTATVNAYLFLKNTMFRIIDSSFKKGTPGREFIDSIRKEGNALQRVYIPNLLNRIREIDEESSFKCSESIQKFHPRLVLNLLEDPKDAEIAVKLRRSCLQYLGVDVEHLGIMYRDDLQDVALGSKLPIIIYKPKSVLSQAIYRLADKLIQLEHENDSPINKADMDQSYESAESEAESDFGFKMSYVEDLLHSGTLSMGDLTETVKSQQWEINQLKKENNLLRTKLAKAMKQGFTL